MSKHYTCDVELVLVGRSCEVSVSIIYAVSQTPMSDEEMQRGEGRSWQHVDVEMIEAFRIDDGDTVVTKSWMLRYGQYERIQGLVTHALKQRCEDGDLTETLIEHWGT